MNAGVPKKLIGEKAMDLLIMVDSVSPHVSWICSSDIYTPQNKDIKRH